MIIKSISLMFVCVYLCGRLATLSVVYPVNRPTGRSPVSGELTLADCWLASVGRIMEHGSRGAVLHVFCEPGVQRAHHIYNASHAGYETRANSSS
jgi:hypothetical protein